MNKKEILPQIETLPEDLIVQILLRLPMKSLLSSKCVCKLWHCLISDPQFAKSHFDMALAPTHRLLTQYNHYGEVCNSVDIDAPLHDNYAKAVFDIPLPLPTPEYGCITDIVGSCRGLVLLTNEYWLNENFVFEFVVWNPSTGFQKRIKDGAARRARVTGFGYDSSTDDYVVVNITWNMKVEWFSFRTNSWTLMQDTGVYYSDLVGLGPGVFFNGALHWLVKVKSSDRIILIIAFDMRERKISEILLPHDLNIALRSKITCFHMYMGESLCVSAVENDFWTVMWTMKQYKVQSSWIKSCIYNCEPLSYFYPLCCTRNGQVLGSNGNALLKLNDKREYGQVLGSNGNALVKLNDKWELIEHHVTEQKFERCSALHCVYRESLLSLPRELEFEKVT